jgi:hypothetical protein
MTAPLDFLGPIRPACELFPQKIMLMSPGLAALHRRKALDGLGGLEAEGFCKIEKLDDINAPLAVVDM